LSKYKNLIWVILFSVAMAYLESAVVVYLRAMYGITDLVKDANMVVDVYTFIELGREAATLVMLFMIGLIAGNTWSKKISYSILAFGIWDIFYYIWLYVFIHWPKSLFEWDILFLIPLPWWGPVIAPVLISILIIIISYLIITEIKFNITLYDWLLFGLFALIILYTFMKDAIDVLLSGNGNLVGVKPTSFNWILFLIGYFGAILTSIKIFFQKKKETIIKPDSIIES
jgi:hypothetical protein